MERDRKSSDKIHAPKGTLSLTKEARLYYGEKVVSSTTGAGKTGQLFIKEWN